MRLTSKEIQKGEKLFRLLCDTFKWQRDGRKIPTSRRFKHPTLTWSEERGGFMDVVYEVTNVGTSDNLRYIDVAFAHIYTQEGDLMYSPEIVARIINDGVIVAIPIEITDHRMGLFQRAIDMDSEQIVSARMVENLFDLSNTVLSNIQAYNYGIKEES